MVIRILACALALTSTAGCASIIRGTSQNFTIQTTPAGAHAVLSTGQVCEATPCTMKLSRNHPFSVTITMPGYETTTQDVTNPWSRNGTTTGIVGNAILGGGIGIGVDAMTGANRDLKPNPLVVTLVPVAAPPAAAPMAAEEPAPQPAATQQ